MFKYHQIKRFCEKIFKKDLYEIIGVSKNSNKNEIKSAFYKKAKLYHPDVNKSGK